MVEDDDATVRAAVCTALKCLEVIIGSSLLHYPLSIVFQGCGEKDEEEGRTKTGMKGRQENCNTCQNYLKHRHIFL